MVYNAREHERSITTKSQSQLSPQTDAAEAFPTYPTPTNHCYRLTPTKIANTTITSTLSATERNATLILAAGNLPLVRAVWMLK